MVLPLFAPLSLASCEAIADGVLAHGRKNGFMPLAVAVLDLGGHLVAGKREDGCGNMRLDIAIAKAWGALGMGVPARTLGERFSGNPGFLSALIAVSDGRLAANAGGVLIVDDEHRVVGAVGVSGDIGENDEACAMAGLEAARLRPGLIPAPGQAAKS